MHATQPQGGACPEPHDGDRATNFFVNLLGDDEQFRTWVASAAGTAVQPVSIPNEPCRCGDSYCEDLMPKGQDRSDCCQYCGYYDCDVCGWCDPARSTPEAPGYVVTDAGLHALADTGEAPGTAGSVLRSAALYLERHGWIQGAYYDPTATIFTPAADMVGAIGMVCYGGPVEAPAQHFSDPGFLDFEEAVLHLDRFLLAEDGSESYEFNDAKGRTLDQVTDVLRQAAARTADELIDALRATDARNADMADRVKQLVPGGIWGETTGQQPGDVSGCSTCDPDCTDGYGCLRNDPATGRVPGAGLGVSGGDGRVQCPSCGRRVPVIDGRLATHLRHPSTPTDNCDGGDPALLGGDA